MKTIITQEIDGYKIVTALSEAAGFIDPIETKKAIEEKIKETETVKRINAIHNQMNNLAIQGVKHKAEVKELLKLGRRNEATQAYQKSLEKHKEMKAFEPELKELFIALKEEYGRMMMDNAVYFQPKLGEEFIEDEKAEEIKNLLAEAIPAGQVVTIDGKKIPDNREKQYWKKSGGTWKMTTIYQLGKESGKDEIPENKLTAEQRQEIANQLENERISKMSKAEKQAERDQREAGLRSQAAQMRNELEVSGDDQALKKAQDWLAAELKKLDEIYE